MKVYYINTTTSAERHVYVKALCKEGVSIHGSGMEPSRFRDKFEFDRYPTLIVRQEGANSWELSGSGRKSSDPTPFGEVLEVVAGPTKPTRISLSPIGPHPVEVNFKRARVGCQAIPWTKVKELRDLMVSLKPQPRPTLQKFEIEATSEEERDLYVRVLHSLGAQIHGPFDNLEPETFRKDHPFSEYPCIFCHPTNGGETWTLSGAMGNPLEGVTLDEACRRVGLPTVPPTPVPLEVGDYTAEVSVGEVGIASYDIPADTIEEIFQTMVGLRKDAGKDTE